MTAIGMYRATTYIHGYPLPCLIIAMWLTLVRNIIECDLTFSFVRASGRFSSLVNHMSDILVFLYAVFLIVTSLDEWPIIPKCTVSGKMADIEFGVCHPSINYGMSVSRPVCPNMPPTSRTYPSPAKTHVTLVTMADNNSIIIIMSVTSHYAPPWIRPNNYYRVCTALDLNRVLPRNSIVNCTN